MDSFCVATITLPTNDTSLQAWKCIFDRVIFSATKVLMSDDEDGIELPATPVDYHVLCTLITKTSMSTFDLDVIDESEDCGRLWIRGHLYGYSKLTIFHIAPSTDDPLHLHTSQKFSGSGVGAFDHHVMMNYLRTLYDVAQLDTFSETATAAFKLKQGNIVIENAFAFCCESDIMGCHRSFQEVAGIRIIYNGSRSKLIETVVRVLPDEYNTVLVESTNDCRFFGDLLDVFTRRFYRLSSLRDRKRKSFHEIFFYCLCCVAHHLQIAPNEFQNDTINEYSRNYDDDDQPAKKKHCSDILPDCTIPLCYISHSIFADHIRDPNLKKKMSHHDMSIVCYYTHESENIENIRVNLLAKTHSLNTMYNT
uniref:U6-like protein n=1 Tax=Glypta fumiferanae TaxID=389681 RepID=A0A0F6T1E3_9HYME|nr:U6-like protein [Glypta fumiferanae]